MHLSRRQEAGNHGAAESGHGEYQACLKVKDITYRIVTQATTRQPTPHVISARR